MRISLSCSTLREKSLRWLLRTLTLVVIIAIEGMGMGRAIGQSTRMPQLAPGVLQTIPAVPMNGETVTGPRSLGPIVSEAPQWSPNYAPDNETLAELAGNITLRRAVWQLEFAFKPMRLLRVEQPDGTTQRIWYLVYKVTNTGGYLKPVAEKDEFGNEMFRVAQGSRTERFFPMFLLRSHEFNITYPDRLVAGVIPRIHAIEIKDPSVVLHDSVSITKVPLRVRTQAEDTSEWGVATWPDVDRRIDFFSVFVQGLSNAYRWEDGENGEPILTYKTLQLNFWRPGDAVFETGREIRYGLPSLSSDGGKYLVMYGMDEPTAFRWVYLP